jgi:hypothetical protein
MEAHSRNYSSQQQQQQQPASAKWLQDNEDSDNDQVGLVPHNRGYKHILFLIANNIFLLTLYIIVTIIIP